jgi:LacI family transcriptional regulator
MKPIRIILMFLHTLGYYRGILRGVRRYVEARPEWLVTSLAPERDSLRVPFRPDGLIASVNTQRLVRVISSWRRPVVSVSAVFPGLRLPRVGTDNVQVGRLAAAHFLERGLKSFGFVGARNNLFSSEREAAFSQALREPGHEAARYVRSAPASDPLARRWDVDPAFHRWLRGLAKPVGIFVPNDVWGAQVVEACRQVELRVPEDVAVLGVGNDDLYCELTRPPLSSIVVPAEQIGYEAAALLDRLLGGAKPPRAPILLPPIGVATRRSSEVLAIDDPDVVAAVRFIREHAHLPLRVTDVLRQIAIGRRTLERRIHRALGWGIGEEIRRTHLERARRLLAETDLPMKVLAQRAGFSDGCHMAVVFRQDLGLTPTAYRRQLRGRAHHAAPL